MKRRGQMTGIDGALENDGVRENGDHLLQAKAKISGVSSSGGHAKLFYGIDQHVKISSYGAVHQQGMCHNESKMKAIRCARIAFCFADCAVVGNVR